jgi:hypothetical protein
MFEKGPYKKRVDMNNDEKLIKDIITGNRVVLLETDDPYTNLKFGDAGTVNFIDDTGTIFVRWENGSSLGLIPGEDKFAIFI